MRPSDEDPACEIHYTHCILEFFCTPLPAETLGCLRGRSSWCLCRLTWQVSWTEDWYWETSAGIVHNHQKMIETGQPRVWKKFKVTQNCDFQSNVYILKIRYKFGVLAKSPNFLCFPHTQAGIQVPKWAFTNGSRWFLLAVPSLLSEALPFYKWGNWGIERLYYNCTRIRELGMTEWNGDSTLSLCRLLGCGGDLGLVWNR